MMTAQERAAELKAAAICARAAGQDRLTVSLPEGAWLPRDFPRRELLSVNPGGVRNYSVSARSVIDWLYRHRLA